MSQTQDPGDRSALDAIVAEGLRPLSAGLAALFGALAAAHIAHPDLAGRAVFAVGLGAAVVYLVAFLLLRRHPLPRRWSQAVVSGMALVALAVGLAHMAIEQSPDETMTVMLVAVAAGAILLSWRWLAVVLVASGIGWLAVALSDGDFGEAHLAVALAASMALAALIHAARFRTLRRLAKAEERFRTLVEHIPAVTYVDQVVGSDAEPSFLLEYVSPQVERLLGASQEQFLSGSRWPSWVHPEDRDAVDGRARRAAIGDEPFVMEYRMVAADGRVVWVRDESVPLRASSKGAHMRQGVLYDITEMKESEGILRQSETELRRSVEALHQVDDERRKLLARLVEEQERERERLAEGVHDDSIQQMAAVGMRLETFRRGLSDPDQLGAIDRLAGSVEQALGRLRHLMTELHPRTLDLDGLAAALRQHLVGSSSEGFSFEVVDELSEEPPESQRAVAYRIALDAIAAAKDRGGATRVTVTLADLEDGFVLRIQDDHATPNEGESDEEGLATLRERAELAGGWLRLQRGSSDSLLECWLPTGEVAAGP